MNSGNASRPGDGHRSERRIMLLGVTGSGKSAAGNTILQQDKFESKLDSVSVTRKCDYGEIQICGYKVIVYDTPGFFDTELSKVEMAEQIKSSIVLAAPGVHVFLLVIPLNSRFTMQSCETVKKIEEMFGEGAAKHTMILFTHGDILNDMDIQTFIDRNKSLKAFVNKYNDMYHVFNNKDKSRQQVTKLMEKINWIVNVNNSQLFTSKKFREAEQKLMDERRKREEKAREAEQKLMDERRKVEEKVRETEQKLMEERRKREEQEKRERDRIKKLEKKVKEQKIIIIATAAAAGAIIGGAIGGKVAASFAGSKLAIAGGALGGSTVVGAAGAGAGYIAAKLSVDEAPWKNKGE